MQSPNPRRPERPIFWIVGGPNGSGKSSFYNLTNIEGWGGSVWIINPDLLTAKIEQSEGLSLIEANLAAVQRVEKWLESSIEAYQTIGVETVLSSPKYRRLVDLAKARGFEVRMIYAVLDSAELQLERIRVRVAEGGHDVPPDKVRDRRLRSFAEFAWFARHVDRCFVFNNSGGEPELAAINAGGQFVVLEPLPADMAEVLVREGMDLR
ncbi:zeta toxin family protein [Sphingomonas sp. SUN039]|uniref:zeta toxin family protein n=1 Tax=Sphingomonas sp. SUN039 TaxID=2937787 RepID=UPI00216486DF|nr:zeta toxin family protein [Sphingomonas sp. SUN039]UVO53409.1 zeta toxin family protein [Sphingomonas sp. SUN039]